MLKPDHLLDHLRNERFHDPRPLLLPHSPTGRLGYSYRGSIGGWRTVAGYIAGLRRWPVMWFPDANIVFRPDTVGIWDALRAAAIGSPYGSTVISGVVEAEMQEWLEKPYHHAERAVTIRTAMEQETWIKKWRLPTVGPLLSALYGYTHLLGFRRTLAKACPDGITLLGTNPADKTITLNAVRNRLGARAEGLAKKGRKDSEKTGFINISDELHCLMTIVYALQNRRDCVILTTDPDHLEIFYKAQWFIDTHYRAWLVARLIHEGRYGVPNRQLEGTNGYFDGPLTLYPRVSAHLREVLPPQYQGVGVGVLYVGGDDRIRWAKFPFETQMLEMIHTRGATEGRCTDLFGEQNVHVDLGPLSADFDKPHLGIGKDKVETFTANGILSRVSRLDLELSVSCRERLVPVGEYGL